MNYRATYIRSELDIFISAVGIQSRGMIKLHSFLKFASLGAMIEMQITHRNEHPARILIPLNTS